MGENYRWVGAGGYCPEGNCLGVIVQGELSSGELCSGNCPGGKSPAGNCLGENFIGGKCPGGSYPGGNYFIQSWDTILHKTFRDIFTF